MQGNAEITEEIVTPKEKSQWIRDNRHRDINRKKVLS